MFKKKFILAGILGFAVASTTVSAENDQIGSYHYFGAFVGAQWNSYKPMWGTNSLQSEIDQTTNIENVPNNKRGEYNIVDLLTAPKSKSKAGVPFGIQIGTLYRPTNSFMCLGFSVSCAFGGGRTKLSYRKANVEQFMDANIGAQKALEKNTMVLNIRDRGHIKAAFLIGAAINRFMPYLQFGFATHRLNCVWDSANKKGKNTWDNRVVLGFGVDYKVSSNVIVGMLFERHVGVKTMRIKAPLPEKTLSMGYAQTRGRNNIIMLNVKYAFPRAQ